MLHCVQGLYRVLNSWKKVLKLAQQFSRPRKCLENGYNVYKNGKKSFFLFFFQSYNKCFMRDIFSVLIKSYSTLPIQVHLQPITKKALFLPFLRSLLITYLITLSLEKEIINCLEKKSGIEKVLNSGSKNLYKSCVYPYILID